jgi:CBS domain-containing protein
MSNVREILNKKGNTIWSVSPQVTVNDTLKLMAEKNVGAVLVLEGKKIAGIFSERDFARHFAKCSLQAEEVPIKDM